MTEPSVRPTFINVGPGRSGTSWLLEMLAAHPDIAMSRIKETEYFNTNFANGEDWYLSHFPQAAQAVGEISNMYYLDRDVPERILHFASDMKIIFNIRDPYTLMSSMVSFALRRGMDIGEISAILETPISKIMGSGYDERRGSKTLTDGDKVELSEAVMLSTYIRRFQSVFPDDQIYFLVFERIERDPDLLLSEIYDFLGVRDDFVPEGAHEKVNAAIEPRIKWVGQIIPRISYGMRKIGAHAILARLHKSRIIKKFLYRERQSAELVKLRDLPEGLRLALEDERHWLKTNVPGLDGVWAGRP